MKRILLAIDFDSSVEVLISKAQELARAFQARVRLIHTEPDEPAFVDYEPGPQYIRDGVAKEYRDDMRQLEAYTARMQESGIHAECRQIQGPTLEKILDEVEVFKADLLIIGSHPHSIWHDLFRGNLSESIIKHAPCSVLVIPHRIIESQSPR
jgi:nucleotide-binding universal stress UspA family protein